MSKTFNQLTEDTSPSITDLLAIWEVSTGQMKKVVTQNILLLILNGNSDWAWQSWDPTYTNFTLGNGTLNYAKYIQIGKTVFLKIKATLGSTSAISGSLSFSTPVTAHADASAGADAIMDTGQLNDATGQRWFPFSRWTNADTINVGYLNSSSNFTLISSTAPFTWATSDSWALSVMYEAA